MSADIRQLKFAWTGVEGATSYRLLQNADGASGFTQVGGDLAATATSADVAVSVHRHDWINALYQLEACNAVGCSASSVVSATSVMLQAIGYFKASNTSEEDNFGFSVAVSADGGTLAVGAPREDSSSTGVSTGVGGDQANDDADDAGAVYVFVRTGAQWAQQAYLKASNTDPADSFGAFLALSADGNTLAVAAPGEDSKSTGINLGEADNDADAAGAVYVFTRAGAQWSQQAYVKAFNAQKDDAFGRSVAISADGNTLAVGATGEDSGSTVINEGQFNNSEEESGAVYVFVRSGTQWAQQAYVKAFDGRAGDHFGQAVALSADGSTLAAGAPLEDSASTAINEGQLDDTARESGAVYVYVRAGTQWAKQAYVKPSNTQADDNFGSAVALSADGGTLVAGAPFEDSASTTVNEGQFNNEATDSGAAYVFVREGTAWEQEAYVKASNTKKFDEFGAAVALSADGIALVVGASVEDGGGTGIGGLESDEGAPEAGAVYVFGRSGTQWSRQSYVKAANTGTIDVFGTSVAVTADGSMLVIGAPAEDSSAIGVAAGGTADNGGAPASGAVFIF